MKSTHLAGLCSDWVGRLPASPLALALGVPDVLIALTRRWGDSDAKSASQPRETLPYPEPLQPKCKELSQNIKKRANKPTQEQSRGGEKYSRMSMESQSSQCARLLGQSHVLTRHCVQVQNNSTFTRLPLKGRCVNPLVCDKEKNRFVIKLALPGAILLHGLLVSSQQPVSGQAGLGADWEVQVEKHPWQGDVQTKNTESL